MTKVRLREISPRLGFQAHQIPTAEKIEYIDKITAAGVRAVEVTSFVNPAMVPGLADAAEVLAKVKRPQGASMECCVGNVKGLQRAIDAGADAAYALLSADELFSRGNTGRSVAEMLEELGRMRELAAAQGFRLGSYIIAAFGGPVSLPRGSADIRPLLERLAALDIQDVILADSCGYAAPRQIQEMTAFAATLVPLERMSLQIHDSRGMGVAGVLAAVDAGLLQIDAALAGSGAHPAAPPGLLVGGVCTEDVVQMLDRTGIETGVDLPALVEAAGQLNALLGGRERGFTRISGPVPTTEADLQRMAARAGGLAWKR